METNIILRKATLNDIELLIRLRIDYLTEDIGRLTKAEETAIRKQLSGYFAKHISNNTFIAIFAELDGVVAATAFLAASEKPASPSFITGVTGTLLNVLTYPKYRRKGIASKVIGKLIEMAKEVGISRIDLSATSEGKFVYEKMGFAESKYTTMNLNLGI